MNAIDIFPWDYNFRTGLPEIDAQHHTLVDLLNQLAASVAYYRADDLKLDQVFDALAQYALHHFDTEEAIWQRYLPPGDEAEARHREAHAQFVQEVARIKAGAGGRPMIEVGDELLGFLARWLAAHILESDRYLACVVEALNDGLPVDAAKAVARERMGGTTRTLIDIILSTYTTLTTNTLKLMRELTLHRQARDALAESRTLLRSVIDAVPIRVFWKDRESRYLGANMVFARDAGLDSPDALVGRDDFGLPWAANAPLYRADDAAVVRTGQPKLSYDEPQTTPTGDTIWLRSSKVPLRDRKGEVIGVLGLYEDISAQRSAELLLRQSEARFHSLYNAMEEGVALHAICLDGDGKPVDYTLLDVNPAFERITGLSRQQVVGRRASAVYGETPNLEAFASVALTGKPLCFQYQYQPAERSFAVSVFSPSDGQFATVFSDITEQIRAQETLRESEERLRLALGAASLGWFDFDLVTGKANLSADYVRMIGYDPATFEVSKENWLASAHPDDVPALLAAIERCLHDPSDAPVTVEYRRRTRDGGWMWFECFGKIVQREPDGSPRRVMGIQMDISERKRAIHEQLRLNRALRLQSECNLALARNEDETALFEAVCRLIVEVGGYALAWVRLGADGGLPDGPPVAVAATDGTEGHAAWAYGAQLDAVAAAAFRSGRRHASPVAPPAGAPAGDWLCIALPLCSNREVLGTLSVLTAEGAGVSADEGALMEELAANLALGVQAIRARRQREAAIAASHAKSAFIANISHEVRTPLNAISGMIYLLRRSGLTGEQEARLAKIEGASQHLLEIINAVLDLSKIDAGKFELETRDIDLNAILGRALTMIQDKAADRHLQLLLEPVPARYALRGDETRLQQVVLNYLSNAVKFTHAGSIRVAGRIIEETDADVLVRIEVADTGVGIAPDVLPRLFQDFEQADNSTTRRYGGTGLGLAIARRIAELMHGEVGVDSVPGQGSTFWFTARLARRADGAGTTAASHTGQAEAALRREFGGRRVLLVEDDAINQEIACCILGEAGLVVEVAGDGQEAVELAARRHYDAILMDMQMPRMDGLTATGHIRRNPAFARVPIIAMTANAYEEDRERCIEAGMTDFVSKPVDHEILFSVLLKGLRQAHLPPAG